MTITVTREKLSDMSNELRAVTRAVRKRDQAWQAYEDALRAAREAGHTLQEIGDAAGLTKMGVRHRLFPDPRKEQT